VDVDLVWRASVCRPGRVRCLRGLPEGPPAMLASMHTPLVHGGQQQQHGGGGGGGGHLGRPAAGALPHNASSAAAAAQPPPAPPRIVDRGQQRRPSFFDIVKSHVGTSEESRSFWPYFRAATALYGSILFWVGAWTMIDHQLNNGEYLPQQHLRDIGVGVTLLLVTDTYYQVGFVHGSMSPAVLSRICVTQPGRPLQVWKKLLLFMIVQLRVIIGLVGSVFVWNGIYNCLYNVFPECWIMERLGDTDLHNARLVKLTGCLIFGLVLVGSTGTILPASGVPFVFDDSSIAPAWGTSILTHVRAFLVSTTSTVGQAFTWFGIYELCMTWCPYMNPGPDCEDPLCVPQPAQNGWKPIALLFIGLALFFATDAFISAAYLDDGAGLTRTAANRRRTVMLYARAVAALVGAMTHNTGLWVLYDEVLEASRWSECSYFGTWEGNLPCWARNLMFTVAGYLVMLASNSAAGNAGVEKSIDRYDMTPTPVLHVGSKRTRDAVHVLVGTQEAKKSEETLRAALLSSAVAQVATSDAETASE
jgi:hypothetical protein